MDLSVVLCTYNRCQLLIKAMSSLSEQRLPEGMTWELIVVDNNSSDQTRQVVEQYARAQSSLRVKYCYEQRQGLSSARNTGIQNASGEVIAFMDDDVTLDADCLRYLTASLFDGSWSGAGGKIKAPQGFSVPEWLALGGKIDGGGVLALFDIGDEPGRLVYHAPYGANMAFRTEMFEKYGGFRTDLGRKGKSLIGNEDTEFGHRLIAGGEPLRYEPQAVVYHPVSAERLNKRYFRAWWFAYGRAMFRQHGTRPSVQQMKRNCADLATHAYRRVQSSDIKERFWWETRVYMNLGEVAEHCHQLFTRGEAASVD